MTKKILVPFDFTEVSMNALKYAVDAFGRSAEYHVVHVHSGHISTREGLHLESGMTVSQSIVNQIKELIIEHFQLKDMPGYLNVRALQGETVPRITQISNEEAFDMAIMGTRDKYDIFDRWFGTTSLGLTKKMDIPVYLIPRYSRYEGYRKVVVASDTHLADTSIIQEIINWNSDYHAYIKFLHVQSGDDDDYNPESRRIIEELFEKSNPEFGFEITTVKSDAVSESLLANAYSEKSDLLIMVSEQQSLLNSLLFQSVSKKIILKSSIPVLFFHFKS